MAYTLTNKYAKNLCKRTVLLQFIIKNVVTCFLKHSVYTIYSEQSLHQFTLTPLIRCQCITSYKILF